MLVYQLVLRPVLCPKVCKKNSTTKQSTGTQQSRDENRIKKLNSSMLVRKIRIIIPFSR